MNDEQRAGAESSEQPSGFLPGSQEFSGRLQAARHSATELALLLEESREYLLAIAAGKLNSSVRPKIAASDIVQETFIKASQGFPQFRGCSQEELRWWLRKILLNRLIDQMRLAGSKPGIALDSVAGVSPNSLEDPQLTPQSSFDRKEQVDVLNAALETLSEDYQLVIRLRHIEHLKFEEIAQRIGRSQDAAEKLWSRAIAKLRERMMGEV